MGKGFAISGFVLTLVSLVFCWFGGLGLITFPSAIVGLILSIVGRKRLKENNMPYGLGTAGLVLGIISVSLTAFAFLSYLSIILAFASI